MLALLGLSVSGSTLSGRARRSSAFCLPMAGHVSSSMERSRINGADVVVEGNICVRGRIPNVNSNARFNNSYLKHPEGEEILLAILGPDSICKSLMGTSPTGTGMPVLGLQKAGMGSLGNETLFWGGDW